MVYYVVEIVHLRLFTLHRALKESIANCVPERASFHFRNADFMLRSIIGSQREQEFYSLYFLQCLVSVSDTSGYSANIANRW